MAGDTACGGGTEITGCAATALVAAALLLAQLRRVGDGTAARITAESVGQKKTMSQINRN